MPKNIEVLFRKTVLLPFVTENGLLQDFSISVTFFFIAINDISNKIKQLVKILLYIDDCNIFCLSTNIHNTKAFVQTSINNIIQWSKKIGFKISPSKCKTILCYRKKNYSLETRIQDSILTQTYSICLLGLIFDHKL